MAQQIRVPTELVEAGYFICPRGPKWASGHMSSSGSSGTYYGLHDTAEAALARLWREHRGRPANEGG